MKKFISIIGIAAILLFVFYMESPINASYGGVSHLAETEAQEVSSTEEETVPYTSLEYHLEDREQVDGYIVETYREYEIYENENGVVVEREPTSNYDYLRYQLPEDD